MTLFNGVLNPYKIGADIPEGAEHVEVGAEIGLQVPAGPNQMGVLPLGSLRLPLDARSARLLGERLIELADELPAPSNLEIATDLGAVNQAAEEINKFRGNGG